MKAVLLFSVLGIYTLLSAESDIKKQVIHSMLHVSQKYDIAVDVLISMAETESRYRPYSISLVLPHHKAAVLVHQLSDAGIKARKQRYKKKYLVSVAPDSVEKAKKALRFFKQTGIKRYDLGLLQINYGKILDHGWDEERILTDVRYNIEQGGKILRNCMDLHNTSAKAIECYNKGEHGNYQKLDYFQKVLHNHARLFGDIS